MSIVGLPDASVREPDACVRRSRIAVRPPARSVTINLAPAISRRRQPPGSGDRAGAAHHPTPDFARRSRREVALRRARPGRRGALGARRSGDRRSRRPDGRARAPATAANAGEAARSAVFRSFLWRASERRSNTFRTSLRSAPRAPAPDLSIDPGSWILPTCKVRKPQAALESPPRAAQSDLHRSGLGEDAPGAPPPGICRR